MGSPFFGGRHVFVESLQISLLFLAHNTFFLFIHACGYLLSRINIHAISPFHLSGATEIILVVLRMNVRLVVTGTFFRY